MTRKWVKKWYYIYSNCFSNTTDYYKHMIIEEDWNFNEVDPDTVELLFPEK